ncbi:MAG: hypothetical protein HS115_11300 [Spirochaetales bacterium]|nr:hypothetical protein [Spirochaetales bacterium]
MFWLPVVIYGLLVLLVAFFLHSSSADEDYFLAGHRIRTLPSLVSVVATETSVATIVVFPAAGLAHDFKILWLCLGFIVGRGVVALWILPALYGRSGLTIYETISETTRARQIISFSYLVAKFLSSGVRFYIAVYAMNKLFPWSIVGWIIAVAFVAGLYSLSGGLRSVILTDQLQALVIVTMGGFLCFLFFSGRDFAWYDFTVHKEGLFDYSLNSVALFLGGMFLTLGTHGADQDTLQRVLATGNLRSARRSLFISGFVAGLVILLFTALGSGLAGYDPRSPLIAYFASRKLDFFTGCFVVLLLAAAMSTIDSMIHSTGAVWKSSLCIRRTGRLFSALSLFLVSLSAFVFSLLADRFHSLLDLAMSAFNYINGGLIACVLFFLLSGRPIRAQAMLAAFLSCAAVTVALAHGFAVAWPYVTALSIFAAFAAIKLQGVWNRAG